MLNAPMGAQASVPSPPSHSVSTECHLVFGKSLKMQALRHVLRTLEMRVAEPADYADNSGELRIAFDGCDAEACLEKAAFVRSFNSPSAKIPQFPIGRVPDISPLFEASPKLRTYQGTIFDPSVEVYAHCWKSHAMRRFWEEPRYPKDIGVEIKTAASSLPKYASTRLEQEAAERFAHLIELLEKKIESWVALKRNDPALLGLQLAQWRRAMSSDSITPLYELVDLIISLETDFETTVVKLPSILAAPSFQNCAAYLSDLP